MLDLSSSLSWGLWVELRILREQGCSVATRGHDGPEQAVLSYLTSGTFCVVRGKTF